LCAQQALVLLTNVAHNLLADFHHRALVESPFAGFGPHRIVRGLLNIPGQAIFEGSQLKRITLLGTHPYAEPLLMCLEKCCAGD
jgi:hypothetical protein